jgi:GLPGLI family protein
MQRRLTVTRNIFVQNSDMKKILLFTSFVSSFFAAGAQMKEGQVLYERTIQMQFRGNIPPEMAQNMPRERKDKFELSFSNNQSLWESVPDMEENNEPAGGEGNGNRMMMRFGGADDLTYHNFETGKQVQQRELNAKNYIVEDSILKLNWKFTVETKSILGHTVQKARTERYGMRSIMSMENGEMKRQVQPDTTDITAWVAMDIPVPAGPEFQGQLPGLILELEINNGRTVYKALEISAKVNASSIKEPKGGKRISVAEFNKERDKTFEAMRQNMPGRGQVQIVTQ